MIRFNDSQILGLDLDKHIALDAGAGTGKTTVMAERYVQHLITPEQRSRLLLPNGPRKPLHGHGALRAPARERTDLTEWQGLLPSEVVAITFTKKAAAELKSRIRSRLEATRALPTSGNKGVFDPRIRHSGDIEMLLSSLDEAPISTIDAFLLQLVSPNVDLVSINPSKEQISEVRSPLLIQETIHSSWRIRSNSDAIEAGVRGDITRFIESRNRLAILVGGQARAEVILTGMLTKSLFVEESKRAMKKRSREKGMQWNQSKPLDTEILLDMFLEPAADIIDIFADKLHVELNSWVDQILAEAKALVQMCEVEQGTANTRFNQLVDLARNSYPTDAKGKLQWVWLVALASSSYSSLLKNDMTFFPKGCLPQKNHCNGWMPGLFSKSKVRGIPTAVKTAIYEQLKVIGQSMNQALTSKEGRLLRILGRSSYLLSPISPLQFMDLDCELRTQEINEQLPDIAPSGKLSISRELQSMILSDLLVVHSGCQDILRLKKSNEGVHDFDDIQRLAADLLLARCPDIVRYDYPRSVVEALDNLGEEPWLDLHIKSALQLAQEFPKCYVDLQHRFSVLQTIRRRFGAFIIDEYQDTNPAHFRLLARLWGRRMRQSDDPKPPLGPWDPTICIVGDMKQSIYRFRQAEVTVMQRTVDNIKLVNQIEMSEPRLQHLKKVDYGRDPRPVGAGGEIGSFSNQHTTELGGGKSLPWRHIPVGFEDSPKNLKQYVPVSKERLNNRNLGHIDLTSNHRTLHNLMETMNGIFTDVFDTRHHILPGDWHAKAQDLRPFRDDKSDGQLEWLIPLQSSRDSPLLDLSEPNNAFSDPNSKSIHLEHELIALRLHSLLHNKQTKLWSAEAAKFIEIGDSDEDYLPKDITILVHSRKHISDLLRRLEARGIPVISDRQGELLNRPVVSSLMAVLNLVAHPNSKFAAVSFARSPVSGLNDHQIHDIFTNIKHSDNWWPIIERGIPDERGRILVNHLSSLAAKGAVHEIFDIVLDHSDLLMAYPDDTARQNAELWCSLVYDIGCEYGHEATEIYSHLQSLQKLGNKGPQSITVPSGGAVKIMTIHGAKGLQSKVVVVSGLFHAGKADSSLSSRNNVLVTPEVVAGRINPWSSRDRPYDGLWDFAKNIDSAQRQAERRREFYVALTRVEDRLILVGSPNTNCSIDESDNSLCFKSKPSKNTMGAMLLDGLRSMSHTNRIENSPWLLPNDSFDEPLSPYQEVVVKLDPYSLHQDAKLGGKCTKSIRIYHAAECFESSHQLTPLTKWLNIESHATQALSKYNSKAPDHQPALSVSHKVKLSPNDLDSSFDCKRGYWVSEIKGWLPEMLRLRELDVADDISQDLFCEPRLFGTLMHRLLELGLQNPFQSTQPAVLPLPKTWQTDNKNELLDKSLVEEVLQEEGISLLAEGFDKKRAIAMRDRLLHLAELVNAGLIGRYCLGQTHHGRTPEALRTELPFFFKHRIELLDIHRLGFSIHGARKLAKVANIEINFDGRADLVLAFRDSKNHGYLQVVDLKTTGCRGDFAPGDPDAGSSLQSVVGDPLDKYPQTAAERDILDKHKLQLTLYSMALEAIESDKPITERREILPPAILIAASGRSVELTHDEFASAKQDLLQHLEWIAQLSAEPSIVEEPSNCSSEGGKRCFTCEAIDSLVNKPG